MKELTEIQDKMVLNAADAHGVSYKQLKYRIKGYLFKLKRRMFDTDVEMIIDREVHLMAGKDWNPNINARYIKERKETIGAWRKKSPFS